jgi:cobalt-zinc-cadmium efflux system outer membrane protein
VEAAQWAVTAAQKQYELVAATLRDGPELGVGMFRERGREINPFDNIVTLRLRIPFATEARNQPRLAAANAVWIEAQTVLEQEQTRIAGILASAREEMEAARRTVGWAQTRRELARDNQQLISRAFELGERDLASRLRAQTEFFDAELAAQRAATELLRAAARVQQAWGQLP